MFYKGNCVIPYTIDNFMTIAAECSRNPVDVIKEKIHRLFFDGILARLISTRRLFLWNRITWIAISSMIAPGTT